MLSLWKGHIEGGQRRVTFNQILRDTANKYGLTVEDLTGPCRRRYVAWPRQEAMWLARQYTSMSLPEIGRRLGGRDHTSIIHGERQHEKRLANVG